MSNSGKPVLSANVSSVDGEVDAGGDRVVGGEADAGADRDRASGRVTEVTGRALDATHPADRNVAGSESTTQNTSQSTDKNSPIRQTDEKAQRVVVVGNGMVGYWFCKALTERDPEGRFAVTVLGDEVRSAYDRVNLTDVFDGKPSDALELADRSWYARRDIELITGDRVVAIDRAAREVVAESGRRCSYDRLVLATGSRPYVPEIPGNDLPGVFVYRTMDDVAAIRKAAESARCAVIIGGGLLGLEAARAVHALGVETVVCERNAGLMSRQLDAASANILRAEVRKIGIKVRLMHRLASITRRAAGEAGPGLRLCFEDAKPTIDADLVIFAAGIRSRDELAREAELQVSGVDRGIVVDDTLTTTDPNIHAIGECVRHRGVVYGLVAPGYEMAEVLADRLLGDEQAEFLGGDLSCRLKLLGVTVGVFGDFQTECRSVSRHRADSRRSLLIQGRRLVGATVIGEWDQIGLVQQAVDEQAFISTRQIDRFLKTGDLWPSDHVPLAIAQWPADRLVCNCLKLSRGELGQAVADGATSCEQLQACTGAGTVCGSCVPLLGELTDSPAAVVVRGRKIVKWASLVALGVAAAIVVLKPVPVPETFDVESGWYQIEKFWRLGWVKQTTGFVLLGLAVVGMALSLRKRVKWLANLGNYGWYRAFHTTLGLLCLFGLIVHTGMRMGDNLNFVLMCVFLGLNIAGAVAGIAAAVEAKGTGAWALRARRWRPALTWAHLILFWPLPVLVGFHIAVAYLY